MSKILWRHNRWKHTFYFVCQDYLSDKLDHLIGQPERRWSDWRTIDQSGWSTDYIFIDETKINTYKLPKTAIFSRKTLTKSILIRFSFEPIRWQDSFFLRKAKILKTDTVLKRIQMKPTLGFSVCEHLRRLTFLANKINLFRSWKFDILISTNFNLNFRIIKVQTLKFKVFPNGK